MVSGRPLPVEISNSLYRAAHQMFGQGKTVTDVKGEAYEGRLCITNVSSCMGSIVGAQFEARIESDAGDTTIRFIIPRPELPSSGYPIVDFDEFGHVTNVTDIGESGDPLWN